MFCGNCGKEIGEKAVACTSCGMPPAAEKKFCMQCGVGINPKQVMCVKCGVAIKSSSGFGSGGKMEMGEAIIWLLCLFPVGYVKMGQGMKGLAWVGINIVTFGLGTIAMIGDYYMCFTKFQREGNLGEWEFFPKN